MPKPTLTISGVILVQTCGACPEQYDAYIEDKKVGYLRLRHGCFYACCPYPSSVSDFDTLRVYEANTMGDGAFEDEERDLHLAKAVDAIKKRVRRGSIMTDMNYGARITEEFQRKKLEELLIQVTDENREIFKRMYPSGVTRDRLPWAITQVYNTILHNKEKSGK